MQRSTMTLCLLLCVNAAVAQPFLVRDGQANAEIVMAAEPPRLVKLAAEELQAYIAKISGALLPVVTEPSGELPVRIYIGRSAHTEALGMDAAGLEHGAFRMRSGENWLALLGDDFDFEPPEPWARGHADRERAQQAWDEMSGGTWGNPLNSVHRRQHRPLGLWQHDQSGSLNAVYEFLRTLGVRWYMPGELGEVVPQQASIALPALDRTVRPDFPFRFWFGAYFAHVPEVVLWDLRLGMNSGYKILGAGMHEHGMRLIHGRPELQERHPEYFAMVGGQRDTGFRGTGHACFTSEGLVQEAVAFARAVFDHLDEPAVSLWPQDGFRQCQCATCWDMSPSDNVWGFVERVARELYKTHPDRWVTCGAYGSYRAPPERIATFSPNVLVFISHSRPGLDDDPAWERHWDLVQGWLAKTGPGRLLQNCNSYFDLVMHPRSFARHLRAMKGLSLGDWNEVRRGAVAPGTVNWRTPGIDHLNLYVNARLLWDAEQDLDALLEEYYTLFYGPARAQMKAAFEYAEAHYSRAGRPRFDLPGRIRFVEMVQAARAAADDTVYGRRIQLILDEVGSLEELRQALAGEIAAKARPDARLAVGHHADRTEGLNTYRLGTILTGEPPDPALETTFQVSWEGNAIVFDIVCRDPDMANLFVSRDVWGGDSVAILLETAQHAYYQIEINPDGEVFDADRENGPVRAAWDSRIDVVPERGDDFWRVTVRIPVVGPEEGVLDPNNFVVGEKPSTDNPWHFNVGRVRIRDWEKDAWTFSPTGGTYHEPVRFGRLVIGQRRD